MCRCDAYVIEEGRRNVAAKAPDRAATLAILLSRRLAIARISAGGTGERFMAWPFIPRGRWQRRSCFSGTLSSSGDYRLEGASLTRSGVRPVSMTKVNTVIWFDENNLKEILTEAPQEVLGMKTGNLHRREPQWMTGFGKLRRLRKETTRIQSRIDKVFEVIEPEDRALSWTRTRSRPS
jgi:hypothetical protein